jgi:acyl-CoA synthetase (AMP-forming)/AMP-acid ligase II
VAEVKVGGPRHDRTFFGAIRQYGDAPALRSADGDLTFAELADSAEEVAAAWGPGRHLVMISCSNTIGTIVAQVAALAHGHVAILLPPDPALAARISETYGPDVMIADGETILREPGPQPLHPDLALLLVTSGSTGSTKLVRLSHRNLRANSQAIISYLAITADDRAITSLPVHYSYGFSVVASHLEAGASLVVTDHSVADPCFWELADEQRITSFAGVPYTYDLIDRGGFHDHLPESLRHVTQAGGHLPPAKVVEWAARGRARSFDFFVMYGQTEATARMAYLPPWAAESAPDAIGQAIPGGRFRLEPVPESAEPGVGELVYTGDNVMMGYAESPADLATDPGPGELRTGDLARVGSDGFYRWVARRNRIAKAFGMRIDLDHLEEELAETGTTTARSRHRHRRLRDVR